MTTRLTPYLSFVDDAREAMEFYGSVFGATPEIMTFGDMGGFGMPEEQHARVMHSALVVTDHVALMAADMGEHAHANGTVSLSGEDTSLLRSWWDGLAEGGEVKDDLMLAPWGDTFGQLTDRFGISWMVNIAGSAPQ